MTDAPAQAYDQSVADPALEFVFRITIRLGQPLDQGTYNGQRRRIIPILDGDVAGPGFTGVVLPGGADWQSVRIDDGVAAIHALSTLQHPDGTIVSMVNRGVRRGPAEVMAKLAAGEVVDPASYYFRASPQFEVQPGPHGWLAQNVFLCLGKRWPGCVHLDIYKVL